jgi:hypothetical protein
VLRDFRRLLAFTIAAALAGACGDHNDNASRQCQAAKADAALVARALPRDAAPAVAAADAAPAEPAPPPTAFDAQMRLMFRIAGCGGDDPLPAPIPTSVVQKHCQALDKIIAEYREHWLDKALPFLAGVVPKDIPDTILYPFGGSDLITALATFPDAREITIISLEHAGDVRVVDTLKPDELADSLKKNRDHLQFLYRAAFQKTADLKTMSRSDLPGHLVGSFVAFHILGYVPVTMRYFVLKEDGLLEYVTDKFSNVEITFRKPGGRLQTYRHIAANLADGPLRKNVGLVAYMGPRAVHRHDQGVVLPPVGEQLQGHPRPAAPAHGVDDQRRHRAAAGGCEQGRVRADPARQVHWPRAGVRRLRTRRSGHQAV